MDDSAGSSSKTGENEDEPPSSPPKRKKQRKMRCFFAEAEGFEPPVPFSTTVFKTAAIDHSATPPEYV